MAATSSPSTTARAYDVIVSEPSNPWMTGVANLFTDEFFAALRRRLRPDGLLAQWFHYYNMSLDDIRSLVGDAARPLPLRLRLRVPSQRRDHGRHPPPRRGRAPRLRSGAGGLPEGRAGHRGSSPDKGFSGPDVAGPGLRARARGARALRRRGATSTRTIARASSSTRREPSIATRRSRTSTRSWPPRRVRACRSPGRAPTPPAPRAARAVAGVSGRLRCPRDE